MQIPFVGADAVASGELTPFALRRWYRPIYRGIYVPAEHEVSLRDRVRGLGLTAPGAVVAGVAASAVHGARWVAADEPIEVVISGRRTQPGLIVRNDSLHPDEITSVAGVRVTTLARTAFDLARCRPRDEAVARLDALRRARRFATGDVLMLGERHPRARGLRRLRTALPLVDGGAESPKETWLRLLFVDAGLPRPTTQLVVYDEDGFYVRRIDMCWPEFKVGAEYDGQQHLTSRNDYVNDVRVARILRRLGWHILHVIKEDRPGDIVAEAREALLARGWRP
ncbi:hypothetical protein V4U86_24220 [Mycobacterium sp. AMU20-3851]|uniref:hypothetical protein n=1 Tax=Mycobacterium sp. AMU20-3851 TaxID=3122055 RepID=UPI003754131D